LSGKARSNTGITGREPGSTSFSRHGVGDPFTALRRRGPIADELVLQLPTFLRSLDLFLELNVLAPRTLTANEVRRGGKQGTNDPEHSRLHSSTSIDFTAAELSGKITISLTRSASQPEQGRPESHKSSSHVRFSNRPSGSSTFRLTTSPVSMSLTGSRFSSDSAPRPFHHGDSKTRWNNLSGGLAVNMTAGPRPSRTSHNALLAVGVHFPTGTRYFD